MSDNAVDRACCFRSPITAFNKARSTAGGVDGIGNGGYVLTHEADPVRAAPTQPPHPGVGQVPPFSREVRNFSEMAAPPPGCLVSRTAA